MTQLTLSRTWTDQLSHHLRTSHSATADWTGVAHGSQSRGLSMYVAADRKLSGQLRRAEFRTVRASQQGGGKRTLTIRPCALSTLVAAITTSR